MGGVEPPGGDWHWHWLRSSAEGAWCPVGSWGPPARGPAWRGDTPRAGLSRSGHGGPPQERRDPPRKGMGSAGLDKDDPPPKIPPEHGQDPPGKGNQVAWIGQEKGDLGGGSECQGMGDPPPHLGKGGSAWEDMGEHPEKGRPRGLSWAGQERPPGKGEGSAGPDMETLPRERGFARPGLRGTPWGGQGMWRSPLGKGGFGLCGHGGCPRKWGPGGTQQVRIWVCSGKRGAQLSRPSQGPGAPQERRFSFPGRRRTRTRASHRGSRSS